MIAKGVSKEKATSTLGQGSQAGPNAPVSRDPSDHSSPISARIARSSEISGSSWGRVPSKRPTAAP
jgi:hypothetical protein